MAAGDSAPTKEGYEGLTIQKFAPSIPVVKVSSMFTGAENLDYWLHEEGVADFAADVDTLILVHANPALTLGEISKPMQNCLKNTQPK